MDTLRRPALRRVGLVAAAALAAGLLAACGTASEAPNGEPAAAGGEFPRTVIHAMGETTVKTKPKRVIVLDTAEADAVTLLGVTPVGAVTVDPVNKKYPAHLQDKLKDVPDVGPLDEPNADKIVSLKPDLILSSKVRHEKGYDQLSKIAPTVFSQAPGASWKQNIKLFAQALGLEDEAADAMKKYSDRAKALGESIKKKNGGSMPTFSVVRFVDGPTRLYQPASFSGVVLADVGVRRPASQQHKIELVKEIGPELIDQADADYVFVCTYGDPAKSQQKAFLSSPLWAKLNAVKNKRVVNVSDDTWMTGIGVQGAHLVLDDIAKAAGVDPLR
jgi:iron complex transport system substrate-binding protein